MSRARLLAHNPNFLKLLGAALATTVGGNIARICLLWLIFDSTGSALDVGYFGAAALVGGISFSLIGGTIVDRYDRRRLMVGAQFAAAATVGLLVVALVTRGFDLLAILAATFALQSLRTIVEPAERTLVPVVVGADSIAVANGVIHSAESSLALIGSSMGGLLLLTVGATVGVGINVVTFLIAGLLVATLVVPRRAPRGAGSPRGSDGFLTDLRGGLTWLRRAPGLLQLTISAGFFNFFDSLFATFLVVYDALALHGSALVFAGLLAALAGGQGLGALLVGRVRAVRYAGRTWVLGAGCAGGLGLLVLALAPQAIVAIPVVFFLGVTGGLAGMSWLTAAQLVVPPEMQGRYFGIDALGSIAIIPLAQVGGGLLIERFGILPTYLVSGVLWTAIAVAFLFPRALATFGYPPRAST